MRTHGRYTTDARVAAVKLRATGATYEAIAHALPQRYPDLTGISRHSVAAMLRRGEDQTASQAPGLSAKTVRNIHVVVHRALKDAVSWRQLARNPAELAEPPRVDDAPNFRTWSQPELLSFLEQTEGSRYHAAWVALATTGLRRGELLGLQVKSVNLDEGHLRIVQSLGSVNHKLVVGTPKTYRSRRTVAVDKTTVSKLRAWHAQRAEERLSLGLGAFSDDEYFFCHPDGRPFHPDYFSREFARAVARYDLPRIRLHDLRHTYASLGLVAGAHVKIMSDRLGHGSTVITTKTYSHVTPAMDADLAERQGALIFGTPHRAEGR